MYGNLKGKSIVNNSKMLPGYLEVFPANMCSMLRKTELPILNIVIDKTTIFLHKVIHR